MRVKPAFAFAISFLLLLILILPFFFKGESKPTRYNIVIRFDDYGIWCSKSWISIEEQLLKLHEKYHVKISFGVIPNSIYPANWHPNSMGFYPERSKEFDTKKNLYPLIIGAKRVDMLKESCLKGVSEIGQHGFYHPKYYSNTVNGEFYGYDYDVQSYKISKGKQILDSLFAINTIVFIPPHNTYDGLTLDLLKEYGFSVVSAKDIDFNSPQDKKLRLKYIPFTTEKFEEIISKYEVNQGVADGIAPIDVLLLHHTSFTDDRGNIDINKLRRYEYLLSLINKDKIRSYHISEASNNKLLMENNKTINKHFYAKISKVSKEVAYVAFEWTETEILLFTFVFCLTISIIPFFAAYYFVGYFLHRKHKMITYLVGTILVLLLFYGLILLSGLYDRSIEICFNRLFSTPLFALIIGVSLCIGGLLSNLSANKLLK